MHRRSARGTWWLSVAWAVSLAAPLLALDPERSLTQYLRDDWALDRGYPGGPVHAIAQTPDGYLWIAAEKGLVRFDGLTFRMSQASGLAAGVGPTVLGLATDAAGTLWARLRGPSLVRWADGRLENETGSEIVRGVVITAMAAASDGGVLLAPLGRDVVRLKDGRFDAVTPAGTLSSSFVIALAQTVRGDIWLGTRDAGLLRVQGRRVTAVTEGMPDSKINCLLEAPDGSLWIGTDRGIVRWVDGAVTRAGLPAALADVPALAMIGDRHGNVWVAAGTRGLFRVTAREVTQLDADTRDRPSVSAVFEDREGNIWAGSSRGIVRLRDTVVTTWSTRQGLPSDAVGPVYVDGQGRTWFASADRGLHWMHDSGIHEVRGGGLENDIIYSIDGRGEDIWVGRQQGGLTRVRVDPRGTSIERFTQANGLAQNNVFSVRAARDGSIWAGTLSGGVSRYTAGAFHTYTVADGLPSNTIAAIVDGSDGGVWAGTPNGLAVFAQRQWRVLRVGDGLPSNDVNALYADDDGAIWVGTTGGLAMVRNGRAQSLTDLHPLLRGSILGLARGRDGGVWLTSADGVFRVSVQALERGRVGGGDMREYGIADGLLSIEGVKRHASAAVDDRGRVWLATTRGLSMADPARAAIPAPPAIVRIEGLSADGTAIDTWSGKDVPAGRQRIVLDYAGLSLTVPERVRFRYRLDPFDHVWSEPVVARQAAYTNLGPGHYVFRVKASNGDGAWSDAEAALPFDVAPMAWQTWWFQLAAGLVAVAAAWGAYRLRLLQVSRQMNVRFDERLAERTRIAQELHDTLLQGFLSASMQLHVATEALPADSPSRAALGRVQDLITRVIDEGRHAVRGLRATTANAYDLERAFAGIPQELPQGDSPEYHVVVQGRPRALAPAIRDDVYRIGREAVVNAFRHAGASRVDLEMVFAPRELQLTVRDNGRGIDPAVVRSGSDGHWGLPGMRERAVRIGAEFKVSSRAGAGTEVSLVVPAQTAFTGDVAARNWSWRFRRWGGDGRRGTGSGKQAAGSGEDTRTEAGS